MAQRFPLQMQHLPRGDKLKMRYVSLICAVCSLLSMPVLADDSSATLQAGGLVLLKTDKIALISEELYLSAKAVKVSYRFRNLTDADYTTTIAFPMPDVTGDPNFNIAIPAPANDNFMKFQTLVDGQSVASRIEQRAFRMANGKPDVEITGRLEALHIPLVPTVDATEAAMARLTDAQRRSLASAGIVESQTFNDDKGRRVVQVPLWTLRSKFWRTQVFPKGKEIVVQQNYVPVVGSLDSLSIGSPYSGASQDADYRKKYCTDEAFMGSARQLYQSASKDGAKTFIAFEQYLGYVITSGGNWAGPIGDFRLIVDKGDPKTLVSFCGDGVKRTGATSFELERHNYMPQRDIDILFLRTAAAR